MRTFRSWLGLVGAVGLASLPATAGAQPVGNEFQVNTYTPGAQYTSPGRAIAADEDGNFVVVWSSTRDGSGPGIFGKRYDSNGAPKGDEFRVNAYTTGSQDHPAIASDAGGGFVVVWQSNTQDGDDWGIFGQRFDSSGTRRGGEFRVNSYTRNDQTFPSVAADAGGNFVVVWASYNQDGDYWGVFGQRYDSAGARLGGEFRVNSFTRSSQYKASVAADAGGDFVVVWESYNQFGNYGAVMGQRYDSEGQTLGGEFKVGPGFLQTNPEVASDPAGNFVVVWANYRAPYGLRGQRYDSAGVPQGPEFRVNTTRLGAGEAFYHDVALGADGNFLVVWEMPDASNFGVFGRAFDSAGVPQSEQFQINAFTTGFQTLASAAANGRNEFVVAWRSDGQDGSGSGVFGRRVLNPAGQAGGEVADRRSRTEASASAAKR